MGNGKREDYVTITNDVLAGNQKAMSIDGKSWLNHNGQGGLIDVMILEGCHTLDMISSKVFKDQSSEEKKPLLNIKKRVQNHIRHLEKTWNGSMAPHELEIINNSGVLSFSLGKIKPKALLNIDMDDLEPKPYLPTKAYCDKVIQELSVDGQSVSEMEIINHLRNKFQKENKILDEDWEIITKRNLEIWSQK